MNNSAIRQANKPATIPFHNGNTGITGAGMPSASQPGNKPGSIPFPNGNTGITGAGMPQASQPANKSPLVSGTASNATIINDNKMFRNSMIGGSAPPSGPATDANRNLGGLTGVKGKDQHFIHGFDPVGAVGDVASDLAKGAGAAVSDVGKATGSSVINGAGKLISNPGKALDTWGSMGSHLIPPLNNQDDSLSNADITNKPSGFTPADMRAAYWGTVKKPSPAIEKGNLFTPLTPPVSKPKADVSVLTTMPKGPVKVPDTIPGGTPTSSSGKAKGGSVPSLPTGTTPSAPNKSGPGPILGGLPNGGAFGGGGDSAGPVSAGPSGAGASAVVADPGSPIVSAPTQTSSEASDPNSTARPVVADRGGVDLVLEDVKYVEPATQFVGPAYRVKFRNQGLAAAGKFRVMLLASFGDRLTQNSPNAVVDVASLGSGQATEVTVRMPRAAMNLTAANGQLTPFTHLSVVLDVDNAVNESDETNNDATIARSELEKASK
jgi:hypothetical protein